MSAAWQVQDAKNRFSEMLERARKDGPQTVTRHGRKVAVVLSHEEFEKLSRPKDSLVDFFRNSPLAGVELDITRSRDTGRTIKL